MTGTGTADKGAEIIPLSLNGSPDLCEGCTLHGAALCRTIAAHAGPTRIARRRRYGRDTQIAAENGAGGCIGILRSGYLRRQKMTADGQRIILGLTRPGDILGRVPSWDHSYTLEAATDAEICMFDAETVRQMTRDNAVFRRVLLFEAAERVEEQSQLVWRRGALTSRERIIEFLVAATRIMPAERLPDGGVLVTVTVSRTDWADMANTTVESISRTLASLGRRGLVTRLDGNRYRIADLGRLARLAGLDLDHDEASERRDTSDVLTRIVRCRRDDDRSQCAEALGD